MSDIRAHDLQAGEPQHPRRARAGAAQRRLERCAGPTARCRWSWPTRSCESRVRFEPLGEEIDCGAEETVLDAAFRQGYNLAYGCREGQCSACKCYLLEGEVELERYSTFALSDTERGNGYALMCRALPESDLVVELLHYDPDNYRLENAIRDVDAEVVEPVTADPRHRRAQLSRAGGLLVASRPVRRPPRPGADGAGAPSRSPTSRVRGASS